MDSLPRLPMLYFDAKESESISVDFERPLKRFIRKNYPEEDPMSFHSNIRELETLRSLAIHAARDASGLVVLKRYYAQLYSLRNRFRMARDESILADLTFEWREIFSDKDVTGDINYEMLAILMNIGILCVELGATDTRSSDSAMKTCCGYFQCASYAFDQVNEQTAQTGIHRSKDMSHDVVSFMSHLSMAQGQECILEKSICDSRKPGIIAKIAAQVSEYYSSCIMILIQSSLSVSSSSSHNYNVQDVIGSREFKNWKKYCEFKISYFSCLAAFFMGISCHQNQKMGESIAWFSSAQERLSEATKHCKSIDRHEWTGAMTDAVKSITEIINKKSEAAKKENDFIFHEMIPSADKLTAIKGASLVKPIPFSVSDPDVIGQDIFGQLVPLEVHVTTSLYTDKKDKLLRDIGLKIEERNEDLESFLSALNLPTTSSASSTGLSLRPKISPLPDELIDICAVLSLKENFLENIEKKIMSLDQKNGNIKAMIKRIQKMIDDEKEAEMSHQKKYGKRAESTLISNLEKELQEKSEKINRTSASDASIKTSFASCLPDLQGILKHHKSARDLNALLPEPGDIPVDEDNIKRLEEILNKINEMKQQRIKLENDLKEAVRKDDVLSKVLMMTDDQDKMNSMFDEELKKFDKAIELINMNLNAQENIKTALIKANADYVPTRKAIMEVEKKRRDRTQEMVSSYETVLRLESSADTASSFYDKFIESLASLESRVKSVCQLQGEERMKHEKKVAGSSVSSPLNHMQSMTSTLPHESSTGMYYGPSMPSIPTTAAPKLKDYLSQMNRTPSGYSSNVSSHVPQVSPHPSYQSQTSHPPVPNVSMQYPPVIPQQPPVIPQQPPVTPPVQPAQGYPPSVSAANQSYSSYSQYPAHGLSQQSVMFPQAHPSTPPVSSYSSQPSYPSYPTSAPIPSQQYPAPVASNGYSFPTNGYNNNQPASAAYSVPHQAYQSQQQQPQQYPPTGYSYPGANPYDQQPQYSSGYWQQQQPQSVPYTQPAPPSASLRPPTTDLLSEPVESFDQNPVLSPTPAAEKQ